MSSGGFPVGQEMDVSYPEFSVSLHLHSTSQLTFEIKEGPFARKETVEIQVSPLGNGRFVVSWIEGSGATVVNVQDFDRGIVHSFATLPGGELLRMEGPIEITRLTDSASDDRPERNKALVLDTMTALFQRRDVAAVERLYAPGYVQHNPDIRQGREPLRAIVAELPADVCYEPGLIVAEGEYVAIHGRITGWALLPQVVVDIFRIENGSLAEHWDVLQNEVKPSVGALAMFDPEERSRQLPRTSRTLSVSTSS
jgi:predicted SnoaL-like aldol condensation-catalyzing enzyme